MSIYLGKIVALFALPLGWVLLASVVALGLLAAQRRRAAGVVIALQWVVLWVCAMPWLNQRLTGWLEAEYPPVALEATPVAEVAVAAFRSTGIAVIPSATDYAVVGPQPLDVLDFLPNADALGGVSFALREWLGRAYYWLRGWGDG